MQAVIICAGPDDDRTSCAKSIRKTFPGDVLTCSTASDVRQQLRRYENQTGITVMLQYYLGRHQMGSKAAQAWHPQFMDALEAECKAKGLRSTPEIKTNVNKDSGDVFLICAWDRTKPVQPSVVADVTLALESSFARVGWQVQPAKKWWRSWG